MSRSLKAVYENGVLKPLEPVSFKEHEQLTITVNESLPEAEEWIDDEFQRYCQSQSDDSVTLGAVRKVLSKIRGSMSADFIAERNDR